MIITIQGSSPTPYNDFLAVVNALGLGGTGGRNTIYVTGTNPVGTFGIYAFSVDLNTAAVVGLQSGQPATFTADFPHATLVSTTASVGLG